jgi:hypothetical protein
MRRFAAVALLLLAACATTPPKREANVRIVADEAEAVLAILDARAAGRQVGESDWQRVFATEGYMRLKKREHSMDRAFEDDAFRQFAMSPELLARRETLRRALSRMKRADLSAIARRAFAYLPPNAAITADIYPVIKPRENSFVFEGNAIFKYLEDEPPARFEETVAHELHHIGYGTACASDADAAPMPAQRAMRKWTGAFGEGLAVLAASGGLHGNPYAAFEPKVRAAWQSGIANYPAEFGRLQLFFTEVLEGKLTGDEVDKRAFEFFGLVGPWYTVGWKMAATIEEELGREELIHAFCDSRMLLPTYNRAAEAHERRTGERLPRWDARIVAAPAP